MKTLSLVSVLIPAYNHEKYIEETVLSIVNQTYKHIELLVLDDGSTDSTLAILNRLSKQYEKRFVRFVVKSQINQGTCATLNRLRKLAAGEYIYIIASDDMLKPNAMEKQISFLQSHPQYVLVVGNNEFVNTYSIPVGWDQEQKTVDYTKAKYKTFGQFLQAQNSAIEFQSPNFGTYKSLVLHNYIPNGYCIAAWALIKAGPFTQKAPLEDWFLMLQLSKLGKFAYLPEVLFSYRCHATNTVKNREKMDRISLQTQQYEFLMLQKSRDKSWLNIFRFQLDSVKLNLGILKVIKRRWITKKEYILSFLGREYPIK